MNANLRVRTITPPMCLSFQQMKRHIREAMVEVKQNILNHEIRELNWQIKQIEEERQIPN